MQRCGPLEFLREPLWERILPVKLHQLVKGKCRWVAERLGGRGNRKHAE